MCLLVASCKRVASCNVMNAMAEIHGLGPVVVLFFLFIHYSHARVVVLCGSEVAANSRYPRGLVCRSRASCLRHPTKSRVLCGNKYVCTNLVCGFLPFVRQSLWITYVYTYYIGTSGPRVSTLAAGGFGNGITGYSFLRGWPSMGCSCLLRSGLRTGGAGAVVT